jgi:SAM-dependent methyltransferase
MLKHAKANLKDYQEKIEFHHQSGEHLPIALKSLQVDFCYSFDVLVHCDIHTVARLLQQVRQVVKPNGMMMLSVANLCSDLGY